MKQLTIICLLALASCTKEWNCTITTTTEGHPEGTIFEPFNGSSTYELTFFGTRAEMKAFEESGETHYDFSNGFGDDEYYYTIDQITECN